MYKVAFLVPRILKGSGGHRTIFQHAYSLKSVGCEIHIYIEGAGNSARASAEIAQQFGYDFDNVHFGWESVRPAELVFATAWNSARYVRDIAFSCRKAYFVQDLESAFCPAGDSFLRAENSYTYGLSVVTIGRWLQRELEVRFGTKGEHFDFCADTSIYHPVTRPDRPPSICFIYQPDKPRRCGRIGIDALGIVKHVLPDAKIYLYGSPKNVAGNIWFEHENLGLLSPADCNRLYNSCSVGLCLSASNTSRIPFEMMASGLPVVELWRENNLYDLPEGAVSLSEQSPESIAENLIRLLKAPAIRESMSEAGVHYMQGRDKRAELAQFQAIVLRLLSGRGAEPLAKTSRSYTSPPIVAGECVVAPDLPSEIRHRLRAGSASRIDAMPGYMQNFIRWGGARLRAYIG